MYSILIAYLTNVLQTAAALAIMLLLAAPTGIAAFRLMLRITDDHPRLTWQQVPVGVGLGLLIVPLALNTLGLIIDGALVPSTVIIVSVALFAALLRLTAMLPRPDPDPHPPLTRPHAVILLVISLTAAVITLPLLIHDTPATNEAFAYRHLGVGDYSKHFAVITALATSDNLPPLNPFLDADPALRYYYHFYMLPAAVMRLSDHTITVGNAYAAASILLALIFPFTLFELARRLKLSPPASLIAAALTTLVGGVDILFMLITRLELGIWREHIDMWSPVDERRISSIATMFVWTPQHVLGLIGFMLTCWVISDLFQRRSMRLPTAIAAAILIATTAGASIYVWIGLLVSLALFSLIETIHTRKLLPLTLIHALVLGVILSAPTLIVLSGRDAAPFLIAVAAPPDGLRYGALFTRLLGANQLAYALDFPAHMLLEFGAVLVFGLIALWSLRSEWFHNPNFRLLVAILIAATLIVLLIRDPLNRNNDFAMRVSPLMWIALALLAGWGFTRLWQIRLFRPLTAFLIGLGLASTTYEVVMRAATPETISADERAAYRWLNASLSPDDTYQYGRHGRQVTLVFVERRTTFAPYHLARQYAADPHLLDPALRQITAAYDDAEPFLAADFFRAAHVDYIIVTDSDPAAVLVSESSPDLADYLELVYENATFRIYRIRTD